MKIFVHISHEYTSESLLLVLTCFVHRYCKCKRWR